MMPDEAVDVAKGYAQVGRYFAEVVVAEVFGRDTLWMRRSNLSARFDGFSEVRSGVDDSVVVGFCGERKLESSKEKVANGGPKGASHRFSLGALGRMRQSREQHSHA